MSSSEESVWIQPEGKISEVFVNNTLTKSKVPLIPAKGNHLKWYTCGPTVYDASHMGHARNYIGFDIIRRILRDYFKFDITLVMNITNIDDKIIARANEKGIPFLELANQWEESFLEDMKALNVEPPDALTRVTEYVPEIIVFIKKIMDNGYAYESNGSVYFDTEAFSKNHVYAKLQPNSVGDELLSAEGEGKLTSNTGDKKRLMDFALWKKSKEGEPTWDSEWGPGRPGWHIECSVMASDILGDTLDIHSGGEDLKFPHHDNEIAQTEAYYESKQWINYFLHSGHLHIDGLKMAKSLKNFITIQAALEKYTARQIRMLFLMHKYDVTMDYSADSMSNVVAKETTFAEFFHSAKAFLRESSVAENQHWSPAEKELSEFLNETKDEIHTFLADNFDTPKVIDSLFKLVKRGNTYLQDPNPNSHIVNSIVNYVNYIFKVFGLIVDSNVGFTAQGVDFETQVTPYLNAFRDFRTEVRSLVLKSKGTITDQQYLDLQTICENSPKEFENSFTPYEEAYTNLIDKVKKQIELKGDKGTLLKICDQVRDETMPNLGILWEDRPEGTVFKLVGKKEILLSLALKAEAEEIERNAKKANSQKKNQKEEVVDPDNMFRSQTDKYSEWDDKGIPTKNIAGEKLSKNETKKLTKLMWNAKKKSGKK